MFLRNFAAEILKQIAMKKVLAMVCVMGVMAARSYAQFTPVSQMERLNRGVVAIPNAAGGKFVSWRLLGTDDAERTTFNLLRNGKQIKAGLTVTNYKDTGASGTAEYQVVTLVDGVAVDTSAVAKAWDKQWLKLTLDRPAGGTTSSGAYTYSPNDCSVGDVDGDGEYELFVKWDPSNSKDNSQDGVTGNVIIDCYKLDGTKLWRIDLGRNIRAGAHYTQFMVYDFDGDGRAEMMCKTAPGSKDGVGVFVNQATEDANIKKADNTKSWLTSSGRMDGGHEYLTVFDGLTGKAVHTIAYNPNRNTKSELSEAQGTFNWAVGKTDTHGYNRGDRYLAAVAYLDGPQGHASGIFCRGYYSYAYVWAVDFDGKQLKPRWLHRSDATTSYSVVTYDATGKGTTKTYTPTTPTGKASGSRTMFSNGNHNLTLADVDGDGCDEIIWGSAALDQDGKLLYATGYGHGDAIHVGKMIPDSADLYVFDVHEEKLTAAHGSWDLHNARTGYVVWHGDKADADNGRGMAAHLIEDQRSYQFWSSDNRQPRSAATGKQVISKSCTVNYRIYWDGDSEDELFDGSAPSGSTEANPYIQKWDGSSFSSLLSFNSATYNYGQSCNTTKSTPCLQADILGDWREELILWNKENPAEVNIYSTWTPTEYAVPTLMHDHTYRMGVAWQNTAYNQPPHLGYFLPDYLNDKLTSGIMGDVNNDCAIDVEDVVGVVNCILGSTADGFVEKQADINGDGVIDVEDVVEIVNIILK